MLCSGLTSWTAIEMSRNSCCWRAVPVSSPSYLSPCLYPIWLSSSKGTLPTSLLIFRPSSRAYRGSSTSVSLCNMLRLACLYATNHSKPDFTFSLFRVPSICYPQLKKFEIILHYIISFHVSSPVGLPCLTTSLINHICLHLVDMFSLLTLAYLAVLGG